MIYATGLNLWVLIKHGLFSDSFPYLYFWGTQEFLSFHITEENNWFTSVIESHSSFSLDLLMDIKELVIQIHSSQFGCIML